MNIRFANTKYIIQSAKKERDTVSPGSIYKDIYFPKAQKTWLAFTTLAELPTTNTPY